MGALVIERPHGQAVGHMSGQSAGFPVVAHRGRRAMSAFSPVSGPERTSPDS